MSQAILDSEEAKLVAVVHKTNQGFSGTDLWKLKASRPELFGVGAAAPSNPGQAKPPPGFVKFADQPGWLCNPHTGVYLNRVNGEFFCKDSNTNQFYALHRGEDISSTLSVRGDAAACSGKGGIASKHVVINDLHKAALSMKLDLGHLDSPAAMFAIYDGRAIAGGPAQAEAAAKGFHVRLLPRLAAYRGEWDDQRLEAALSESIAALAKEIGAEEGGGVSVAVALLLGRRLALAASRSCRCMLLDPEDPDVGTENDVVGRKGQPPATQCVDLALHETHMGVFLSIDAISAGLSSNRLHSLVRPHMVSGRLKAACVAIVGEAQKGGAEPPLVAAAVRLVWSQQDDDLPPAKRAKSSAPAKVRCRHILLRHVGSQITTGERVKKKPTRTQGEAEASMLDIFTQIMRGDPSSFTTQCRAVSECDTALRGGDLAGDVGWLDTDPAKNKKVPAAVTRAALALVAGQMSDIVSSERGVHLVLRTA